MTPSATTAGAVPRVSVVVPTRDRGSELARALASLQAQTLRDFEIVVVDDGSREDLASAVATCSRPAPQLLHQPPRGVSAARNAGARTATAPWLAFLASDDEAQPEWLARLAAGFGTTIGISSCGIAERTENGGRGRTFEPRACVPEWEGRRVLFMAGGFAVRREIFGDCGGYDEELAFSENTELGFRLVDGWRQRGLDVTATSEPLVTYRSRPARRLDREGIETQLAASRRILDRHRDRLAATPRVHALLLASAAVRAARLGGLSEARRDLLLAIRERPLAIANYLRL